MDPILIRLKEADLVALWATIIDEDGEEALAFLKERIVPQIPAQGIALCDSTRLNPYLLKKRSNR